MIRKLWQIVYDAGTGFFNNRLSTAAAAMAFYTMFALGPILIFVIAVAEPFVGKLMAQQAVFDALGTIVEPKHLKSIQRFASEDLAGSSRLCGRPAINTRVRKQLARRLSAASFCLHGHVTGAGPGGTAWAVRISGGQSAGEPD